MNHHSIAHKWVYLGSELQNWSLVRLFGNRTLFFHSGKATVTRISFINKKNLCINKTHTHIETVCMGKSLIIQRRWDEYSKGEDQWETTKQRAALTKKGNAFALIGERKKCKYEWRIFFLIYNMNLNTFKNHSPWSILGYYRLNERGIEKVVASVSSHHWRISQVSRQWVFQHTEALYSF